jgi:UDP-N-acetylglucosamine 2-epimerase (non-hydrolysing)
MKVAPLLDALAGDPDFASILVHTGQHYDARMSGDFFRDLGLPVPDDNLGVGSGSHAQQTAEIMKSFEPVLLERNPDAVVVVGDVNSTVACSLVAKKLGFMAVHVEAGLRSFDRSMPEEINRVVTDAIADLLLVTEESGRRNLLAEGIPAGRIHLAGNLMIDSLFRNLAKARNSPILSLLGINGEPFGLATLHRPANVDEPRQFGEIWEALVEISREVPLYFPAHPRTRHQMERLKLANSARLRVIEPLGYLDFLCLMSNAAVVLTDSGGIQEETTGLKIPCITLRDNTERPITIEEGTNTLGGTRKDGILAAWRAFRTAPKRGIAPEYWDGNAARRCIEVFREHVPYRH